MWVQIIMCLILAFGLRKSAQEFYQNEELRKVAHRFTEEKAFRNARDAWAITTLLIAAIIIALILGIIF